MIYKEKSSACSTTTSNYGSIQDISCSCPPPPIDHLKFTAYKKIVCNYDTAVQIAIKRKLVLGEPCVIPFRNGDDIELLFAIGSMTEKPFIKDSVSMDNLDNAWINDPGTGEKILIVDWIKKIKADILSLIEKTNKTITENKATVDASLAALDSSLAYQISKLEFKINNITISPDSSININIDNVSEILLSNEEFINNLITAIYSNETLNNNINAVVDDKLIEFASNFQYMTFDGTLYD